MSEKGDDLNREMGELADGSVPRWHAFGIVPFWLLAGLLERIRVLYWPHAVRRCFPGYCSFCGKSY